LVDSVCLPVAFLFLLLITSSSATGTPLKGSYTVTLKSLGLVEGNTTTLPSTFLTKLRGAMESLSNKTSSLSKYLAFTLNTLIPPPS